MGRGDHREEEGWTMERGDYREEGRSGIPCTPRGPGGRRITTGVYILEGTKPRVANPRVGSGTGFGGPGGGSGGPGGGFVIVVKVMAKPLLRLL